jgi:carbamoyltransferase
MNILGINEGHMSSAALIQDGKLTAAICEERFSRNKNEMGYPKRSIQYCLETAGITKSDIDQIGTVTLELPAINEAIKRYSTFGIDEYLKENELYWKPKLLENKNPNFFSIFPVLDNDVYDFSFLKDTPENEWSECFRKERIRNIKKNFDIPDDHVHFVDHHTGHASYAYFMSPFRENTLILTADAFGDGCNCSIWVGNNSAMNLKFKSPNHNLARLYKYITLLLGMKPNEHEYKVMGLAPYANNYVTKKPYEIFKSTMYVDELDFKYKVKPTDNYFWFKEKLEGCRFDGIAAGLQKYVEETMMDWVRNALSKFNCTQIVLSGGFALNIKVNQKISQMSEVNNIFVPGGGGDESLSIGTALFLHHKFNSQNIFSAPMHDYHGPEIFGENIENILEKHNSKDLFNLKNNPNNHEIAELISNDFIVARCKGKSEFGPRALGNRSILANPSNRENVRKINNQIKYRDFWMPFTPSILLERINDYIENPKNLQSPYMTIAFESTPLARKELIGGLHPSDYTARPQFVDKNLNSDYHDLISKFQDLTGIGGLLNTSLNLHGEPIVGNEEDAIHTLLNSDLDAMILGNTLLTRKK